MDDADRYRRHLQESLLTEGWEEAFDFETLRAWVRGNHERLSARATKILGERGSSQQDMFTGMVEAFRPQGKYDLPTTEAIFRSLFDSVCSSARSIGVRPIREVEIITSTSIYPTPFARPTTGTHQLFIGPGTSAFCNYWAKAFTAIVMAISASDSPNKVITSKEDMKVHLSKDPSGLLLAARLALYYGLSGTLLGFGNVDQPPSYLGYRM